MPTGTWPLGWATGDVEIGAEYKKGIGALFDSTLGGSAANVDMTSIVGTYAHLLLVVYARGDAAATSAALNMRLNNDSAANYDFQQSQAAGTFATTGETFAATQASIGNMPANTAGANLFSAQCVFIPHYAGSANNKIYVGVSSIKTGTSTGNVILNLPGGFWRSTAAITRITLLPGSGNFVAGTRVSLYGMGA